MSKQPSDDQFLKDVASHQMTVLLDHGVYRHLRFAKPDSIASHFELVTGPGFLLYRGDMGCFEFERLHDMFDFFRSGEVGQKLKINLSYWAEKLEATDKNGGYQRLSEAKFRDALEDDIIDYLESHPGIDAKNFRDDVDLYILRTLEDSVSNAIKETVEFDYEGKYPFQDFYEHSLQDYTYHYVWCCYAIVWGIQQYDQAKTKKTAEAPKLEQENKALRSALERIVKWKGEFPETGRFWDEPKNTNPMSYAACYGSDGERDYMRKVARDALDFVAGGNDA
jgi:hypothetical protein